jgi:hypothetical protein
MNNNNNSGWDDDDNNKHLDWDLRQVLALEILRPTLLNMKLARMDGDYNKWLSCCEELYDEIQHKFDDRINEEKEYNKLLNNIVVIANKNPSVWTKQGHNVDTETKFKVHLRELQRWLWIKMEDYKFFGAGGEDYNENEI